MTARLRRRFRGPRALVRGVLEDAGRIAGETITRTSSSGARLVVIGAIAGLIVGAGLVWLGVSIGRQLT